MKRCPMDERPAICSGPRRPVDVGFGRTVAERRPQTGGGIRKPARRLMQGIMKCYTAGLIPTNEKEAIYDRKY